MVSFFVVLATASKVDLGKFLMLLWSVWWLRNERLWKDVATSSQAMFVALEVLCDWFRAKELKHGDFVPPSDRSYKIFAIYKCNKKPELTKGYVWQLDYNEANL